MKFKFVSGYYRFYHNSGKQNILKLGPTAARIMFNHAHELDVNNIVLEKDHKCNDLKGDTTFIYDSLVKYNNY